MMIMMWIDLSYCIVCRLVLNDSLLQNKLQADSVWAALALNCDLQWRFHDFRSRGFFSVALFAVCSLLDYSIRQTSLLKFE